MAFEYIFLTFIKLVIVMLGGAIVLVSYSAYRRMRSNMMLFVTIGFGFITLAALIEGILFEFLKVSLFESHLLESIIVLAGFLTLIYALRRAAR